MRRFLFLCPISIILAFGGGAFGQDFPLRPGLYELKVRLEMPHLERYATTKRTQICVGQSMNGTNLPIPVLSGNGAFDACRTGHIDQAGADYRYEVICAGRASARAKASYRLTSDRFQGRVAIVLGAKNMTMTEIQTGRRLGACDIAGML